LVYKKPCGSLMTPKKLLNGEARYNLSSITSTSHIPNTSPVVECQLDIIVPFSLTFKIVSRGFVSWFKNDNDSKCPTCKK
jgi:hypothetical protein